MDGNLAVAYDVDTNFITAWNEMFVDNDFLNANTGLVDPRHMFGTSNFDVFRWPSLENGTQRSVLGTFITTLVMPGIPLVTCCPYLSFSNNLMSPLSFIMVKSRISISMTMARPIISTGDYHVILNRIQTDG